jgi:thiol:disulfide interchange protein DsbD
MKTMLLALGAVFLSVASWAGHVDASLLSSRRAAPPGEAFDVGVRLHLRDGWHVYWLNPGDSGMSPRAAWTLPSAWTVEGPEWPAPERIVAGPVTSFGYEKDPTMLFRIRVPTEAKVGKTVELKAAVDWLECKEICTPGKATVSFSVAVEKKSVPDAAGEIVLSEARAAVPRPDASAAVAAVADGENVRLLLSGRHPGAQFFPFKPGGFDNAALSAVETASNTELLAVVTNASPARLEGVLTRPGLPAVTISLPVKAGAPALRHTLLAFLGGLLLNLMPCVFPVLSLKVLGLLNRAGGKGATAHAGAYAVGVILSFQLLAGALLAARAAGASLGWGFQMQSPAVVAVLAALFIGVGLNLLGVFELSGPTLSAAARWASGDGLSGSFFSGVFAVVVAAPCTAPFMGAALGWALVRPAPQALLVFAALGAGTAAPYALLASWPALLRRLPKPGAWMHTFKRALSLPMFATAAWLLWVLWRLLAVPIASDGLWKAWSPEAVTAARASGKTVFTDYTASWCLTCQANERLIFTQKEVLAVLTRPDVAAFKADWTGGDPRISAELARHGRSGVPLYVVYPKGGEAVVLPEVLTSGLVLQALGSVSSPQGDQNP